MRGHPEVREGLEDFFLLYDLQRLTITGLRVSAECYFCSICGFDRLPWKCAAFLFYFFIGFIRHKVCLQPAFRFLVRIIMQVYRNENRLKLGEKLVSLTGSKCRRWLTEQEEVHRRNSGTRKNDLKTRKPVFCLCAADIYTHQKRSQAAEWGSTHTRPVSWCVSKCLTMQTLMPRKDLKVRLRTRLILIKTLARTNPQTDASGIFSGC